jgi:hypothetical protein
VPVGPQRIVLMSAPLSGAIDVLTLSCGHLIALLEHSDRSEFAPATVRCVECIRVPFHTLNAGQHDRRAR